jgi:stage V sporulation protein B
MKKLVKAVLIVTIFTFIDRLMGFGFKVYLSRSLGDVNLGIYQVALSMFFVLITFTTSGTPLIVSKLTAVFQKKGDIKSEHSLVAAALVVGLGFASVISLVFFTLQKPLSKMFASPQSMTVLLMLLPGVLFSGIYAAFRGNLWGRQKYVTISAIELAEQTFRIFICVLLITLGLNKLRMTALSMSAACGLTAILCIICYFKSKGRLASPKGQLRPLIKQALPITMIRASNTVVNSLISIAVPFLLCMSGMNSEGALAVYGRSIGMAMPLLYLPITVVGSLAYVMIPTLSSAYAANDLKSVRSQIETSVKFSLIVAAIFVPVFTALGKPLGSFIYKSAGAGQFLSFSAWLLIPIAAESIVSSMMNSLNLEKRSFINYLIGAALMFGIMFAAFRGFTIELLSIAMGAGWTLSTILDIFAIKKKTGIKLSFLTPLIKCVVLTVPSVFVTKWLYTLTRALPEVLRLLTAAGCGIVFFCSLLIVFGVFDLSLLFRKRLQKPGDRLTADGMDKRRLKRAKRL